MEKFNQLQIVENKPSLIVLCGLQCSGKSTYAQEITNAKSFVKFSSDDYRFLHPNWSNEQVFGQLYRDLNETLSKNLNCILDATSITVKARKQVFLNVKVPCYKIITIFNTPYHECLERLIKRNASTYPHKVPEEILKRYYYTFEIPFYEEGWDCINIINHPDYDESQELLSVWSKLADGFDQQNKHHSLDLGQHMKTVAQLVKELGVKKVVVEAANYHDIGKLSTQVIGEDGQAHYYDHANVGAYNLMCLTGQYSFNNGWVYDTNKTLEWLFYINYHMHMYNIKTEKSIKKWAQIFGEEKFTQLKLLNQADSSNHINGEDKNEN